MRPIKERIKDLITSSTVHINQKNRDPYDIRNLTNMALTSNQQNPVQIDPQERRFVVFECNASKKGDTEYFQKLGSHLERNDVARAFFQYLRDLVDVHPYTPFQSHRPQTDAYAAMQQRNIPLFYKFLSAHAGYRRSGADKCNGPTIPRSVLALGARWQLHHQQLHGQPVWE